MSEVNFEKSGYRSRGSAEFEITVGDETQILRERFMEREPTNKRNAGICGSAFQCTINVVYRELMQHEKICNEQSIIRSPWPPRSDTDERRSFGR